MSELSITDFHKADYSFYTGYQQYKADFKKGIAVHAVQAVGLLVFLPIDIHLL